MTAGLPYTKEELYRMGPQRSFRGDASEAAFLLGGIGTGNVSLGARGELRDWEIFNRPGKGNQLPYTFFALWTQEEGKKPMAKVLESRLHPPFSKSHGFSSSELAGLPRLKESVMKGEYPFVWIDFFDDELPVKVTLEAYTPLIPLNPEDSGIPCAIFRYKVKNISQHPVNASITGSIANAVGFDGYNQWKAMKDDYMAGNVNELRKSSEMTGLYMYSSQIKKTSRRYGNMALMTWNRNTSVKPNWLEGGWWDGIQDFWDDLCQDGLLEYDSTYGAEGNLIHNNRLKIGSLGVMEQLLPGEEKEYSFILTWYFPNRVNNWNEDCCSDEEDDCCCNEEETCCSDGDEECCSSGEETCCSDGEEGCCSDQNVNRVVRNHYGLLFKDAWDVGEYVLNHMERLEKGTRDFHKALFSSTLPSYVLDAIASNINVIRSTTCFWLENGTFLGWEGCHDNSGCCEGSCTHVWNYAQTMAFLFPTLERSMRQVEFNMETDESGSMAFRTRTVFQQPRWDFHPAADGQMGTIIRLYREWKLSGDHQFLQQVWEGAKNALDFAFTYWDSDGDYVLDSQQHNTYDIEFYGPNSLVNSMFFAALKAGEEMAGAMGDDERSQKYALALEKGSKRMDELLWGGEYYIQKIEDVNAYKYQYGEGCLSDQLLGQFMSHVAGLGYILPRDHVRKAIHSIFKYNFRREFHGHHNVQRTYALNDEKGLLLCSWPKGGRPRLPFVYSDEVWTGIEYQVAAHLIYEGYIDEGLTLVKAVRERHDGYRRNPWNEVECGHHYARSMASWGVLTALSGYRCDMVNKVIQFAPKINQDDFRTFWSCGTAWGIYTQKLDEETGKLDWKVEVLYGDIDGIRIKTGNEI